MAKRIVYSKHTAQARCGVAYFSALLAQQLQATHVQSFQGFSRCDEFYINLDILELTEGEVQSLLEFIRSKAAAKTILLMHDYRFSYLEDALVHAADVVLNLSGEAALNALAPKKILQLFTPSLVEAPILKFVKESQHPFTLSFGFFSPRKKTFRQYVEFYEYMVKHHPDWYHIIAASAHTGDTSTDSQTLGQMIQAEQVIVTEFLPNQILAELIHAADLGVCFYPTGIMRNNAAPMSFFAASKTVITTYGDLTPPEYRDFTLDGQNWQGIDWSQPAQLQTLGQRAHEYYTTHFSWSVFIAAVEQRVRTV